MTRLTQIEVALKAINEAKFQQLCDAYFLNLGYDVKSNGSVIGKEKTKKGTPDSYILLENDKYIFIEYTTREDGLFKKLSDDIAACFDTKKVNIPISKIEKIILCFNDRIGIEQTDALRELCQQKNVALDLINFDTLRNEIYRYRQLAKDFLDIQFDTGQILKPQDFVKSYAKHPLKIPIDQIFRFRENELQDGITNLLETDILLISGKAGVGKTRFALELGRDFTKKHPEYDFYVVYNKELDLVEDFQYFFSVPDKYFLILIDDANRISKFHFLLHFLLENPPQKVKFILTVRDYALDEIKQTLGTYPKEVHLDTFTDENIKILLENEFNILNDAYQKRIIEIADGNARLAIMAGIKANETQDLKRLFSIEDIYEKFFIDILEQINEKERKKAILWMKVLGLMSFFRFTYQDNTAIFHKIQDYLAISFEEFWEAINELHQLELVDLYERSLAQPVAKIADQTLATYFFYKVFIKEELLSYDILLTYFFDGFENEIRETIYSAVNNFGFENIDNKVGQYINKKWQAIQSSEQTILKFLQTFWFALPIETLNYLYNEIDNIKNDLSLSTESVQDNTMPIGYDVHLEILKKFGHYPNEIENFKASLEIIFIYLLKYPVIRPKVIEYFKTDLIFDYDSSKYDFVIQTTLFDFIFENISASPQNAIFQEVLLDIIPDFLKTSFQGMKSGRNFSYEIQTYPLPLEDSIKVFRKKVWEYLFSLYRASPEKFTQTFENYIQTTDLKFQKEILSYDAELILPFLEKDFDNTKTSHCNIVQNYLERLDLLKISSPHNDKIEYIKKHYTNPLIILRGILGWNSTEWIRNEENYKEKKRREIKNHFALFTFKDYVDFLEIYPQIIKANFSEERAYRQSLEIIFEDLYEKDIQLLFQVLDNLFSNGNLIEFSSYQLVEKIMTDAKIDVGKFYKLMNKENYTLQTLWKLYFFVLITENEINTYYIDELLDNFENLESNLFVSFLFLEKYQAIEPAIFDKVIRIVVNKISQKGFKINFYHRFWEKEAMFFENNLPELKQIYFYQLDNDRELFDYENKGFKFLLDRDENFIFDFLDYLYQKDIINLSIKHKDYEQKFRLIWDLDNYAIHLESVIDFIIEKKIFGISNGLINSFFGINQDKEITFIENFIEKRAFDKEAMRLIFDLIIHTFPDKRNGFLAKLLNLNPDFELFSHLPLVSTYFFGASDGFAYWLEERIKKWKAIKSILTGVKFLKHIKFVNEQIDNLQARIKDEKARNFLGAFPKQKNQDSNTLIRFLPLLNPELKIIYNQIKQHFPFLQFIIWTTKWLNQWTIHQVGKFYTLVEVEGESEEAQAVFHFLQEKYDNVFLDPDENVMDSYVNGVSHQQNQDSIIVKNFPENAPIEQHLIYTASLEKILVDIYYNDVLFATFQGQELENIYQNVFEKYSINEAEMLNYASNYDQSQKEDLSLFIQKFKTKILN